MLHSWEEDETPKSSPPNERKLARSMDTNNRASGSGKEKKTRRRLRLSCVECTKRRQKCDRTYPCSLCVSRGVSHLCRWETVPLARPAPARPPVAAPQVQDATIPNLIARIASLEKALEEQRQRQGHQDMKIEPMSDVFLDSPSCSSTLGSTDKASPCTPTEICLDPCSPEEAAKLEYKGAPCTLPLCYLGQEVYATTSTLAQLALGHHGEYVGRGSLICALHGISTGKKPRFLYAKSTDPTSPYRNTAHQFSSATVVDRVEELIKNIPPMMVTTALVQGFFRESNWRFGIPEGWFRSACAQMWTVLEYPGPHGLQINANWLSLLFSVLAFGPRDMPDASDLNPGDMNTEPGDIYFVCAMNARRIAEDDYLNKPNLSLMTSAADGTVLGCLAIPLLCSYLSERGRVSEAWKLVGNGIRSAEAVGMHRDPEWKQWHVMSEDEMLLRRRAWWGLVIWDKMYSYLLSRPQMIRKEIFDVALPSPVGPDGTKNRYSMGQIIFIQLASLVGEAMEKCFCVEYPNCSAFFEMDEKFKQWEDHLPPEYQQHGESHITEDVDPTDLMTINHQRYTLNTWYLLIRTKLHVAATAGSGRAPQLWTDVEKCRRACILLAMRLIRLQCETHDAATRHKAEHAGRESMFPGSNWFFEGCFSLLEATIALLTTLTRYPWKEKLAEADELVNRVVSVFSQVVREEAGKRGEIARMASEVLGALRQDQWEGTQLTASADSLGQDGSAYPTSIFFQTPVIEPKEMNAASYDLYMKASQSGIFAPSAQYSLGAVRNVQELMFMPNYPGDGTQAIANGTDIHMVGVLREAAL